MNHLFNMTNRAQILVMVISNAGNLGLDYLVAMGSDVADLNGDGYMDFAIVCSRDTHLDVRGWSKLAWGIFI